MKKKVINTAKSRKIREDAIKKMRQAQENIDPELLEKARQAIATSVRNEIETRARTHKGLIDSGDIPVDRKKNLQTIMAFVKGLDGKSDFQKRIEKDLKDFIESHPEKSN